MKIIRPILEKYYPISPIGLNAFQSDVGIMFFSLILVIVLWILRELARNNNYVRNERSRDMALKRAQKLINKGMEGRYKVGDSEFVLKKLTNK